MATTLKDIAAAAQVSIGTVERALKYRDRINPQVAERIRQIAKDMDYHPNKIASGLVNRTRKYKIAVVLHIAGNEFFNEVLTGIRRAEREIRDYGISLEIYYGKDFDPILQLSLIEKAIAEGANALIVVPINSPLIARKIRQLNKENFPVVFLNTYLNRVSCLSSIHCDYHRSGRIGGMLLHRLSGGQGKAIAFLPSSAILGNNFRKMGFEDYFRSSSSPMELTKIVELSSVPDLDKATMRKELADHPDINSILYCGNTEIALSSLEGVDRPVTLVVYDLSLDTRRALLDGRIDAAIVQSPAEEGYQSVNVIFQYLTSQTIPQKHIIMDSHIIFRECID